MAFPKYESYKDSGVDWLGDIPIHWNVKRNLGLFDERIEVNQPDMELLSVTIEKGVIKQSEIPTKKDSSNEDKSKYKVVRQGDLAYNKMRMWQGAIGRSNYDGIVSPAYIILKTRNKSYSRYFHYLYRTKSFIREANCHSYGLCSDMNSLRYEDFKTIYSPIPPLEEAERIVEFLDRKTSEIDQAIAQKQRLIKLLQEQKAILINQAVTKGLNPNVPMRDSSVDWIGEIPEHWIASRIGFLGTVTKLTGFEYTNHWKVDEGGKIIALRGFNIGARKLNLENTENISRGLANKLERSKLSKGDLVVPCTGTLGNAAVIQEDNKYHINQNIAKIRINKDILPEFLCYWMTSDLFKQKIDKNNVSGMQPVLLIGDIRKLQVVVPPVKEQKEIVKKLNQVNEDLDFLIGRERVLIELLETFRKSCIASTVTGKIKV